MPGCAYGTECILGSTVRTALFILLTRASSIMRYVEDDGLSVFRQPSMNSNGNTIDREGRLITCEHSGRRVTRSEHDGSITIIADKYNGKKLNSPNDVVVASDGSIWFTDPTYGIRGFYMSQIDLSIAMNAHRPA
jgi:sugar lactone lactonase YvrE